jgi:hypothetical protein
MADARHPRDRRRPGQAVPRAGLYADGCTGRTRMVADDDHGYLPGVTFVGPAWKNSSTRPPSPVVGQVPISGLCGAVPLFPSISEVWLRLLEAYRA